MRDQSIASIWTYPGTRYLRDGHARSFLFFFGLCLCILFICPVVCPGIPLISPLSPSISPPSLNERESFLLDIAEMSRAPIHHIDSPLLVSLF